MDSFNLLGFLESYTLPSLIISAITAIAYILVDRFFSEKIKFSVKSYFPFATGILLNFLFALISTGKFSFDAEIFSSGILCGSLATMVFALFKRIKRGETAKIDAVLMIIEGIICDYVSDSAINVTAMAIRSILCDVKHIGEDKTETESDVTKKVAMIIKRNSDKQFSDEDFYSAARLTVTAVENYKKS